MSALARLAIWCLALGLALLPVVAVLNGWLAADRWPIEQLRIHAVADQNQHADDERGPLKGCHRPPGDRIRKGQ